MSAALQQLLLATTPADLGVRSELLVDKHAAYIKGFSRIWEVGVCVCALASGRCGCGRSAFLCVESAAVRTHPTDDPLPPSNPQKNTTHNGGKQKATDRLEAVATEHFWMSGVYWGLTAMALMGRLEEMDTEAVADWVLSCRKGEAGGGGFGASPRNDAHLLSTLSAVQVCVCVLCVCLCACV